MNFVVFDSKKGCYFLIIYISAQEERSTIVVNGTVEQEMWSWFNFKTVLIKLI